jgi:hypothetical protein
LNKDRDVLLTFYDFPAEHWIHVRTTNPIESVFATVRLRLIGEQSCSSVTRNNRRNSAGLTSVMIRMKRLTERASCAVILAACLLAESGARNINADEPIATASTTDHLPIDGVYPQGKRFPLALYSIADPDDLRVVRQFGFNLAHNYGFNPAYLETCAEANLFALASLSSREDPKTGVHKTLPAEQLAEVIQQWASSDWLGWWDLPEERRYWIPDEMAIIRDYGQATRQFDPAKRPNYMYLPGHYPDSDVAHYVPHLDLICASVYTTYSLMPHAWVRWRMESTVRAIEMAGATIGANYLAGEKTPVAVLQMFYEQHNPEMAPRIMTAAGAYHDVWECIVSGARGLLVFSYYHRRDKSAYEAVWQAYAKAASEISGPEQLGQMILHGRQVDAPSVKVVAGCTRTVEFIPHGTKLKPISFPSIHVLAKAWRDHLYVIAVNSADDPVTAELSGLPDRAQKAVILFESRTAQIDGGKLRAEFAPLGVHIYKVTPAL